MKRGTVVRNVIPVLRTGQVREDRRVLLETIRSELELGGVTRLVLEAGQPMFVERVVREGDDLLPPGEPAEIPDGSLDARIRAGVVIDLSAPPTAENWPGTSLLLLAFNQASVKRCTPFKLLWGRSKEDFRKWLAVPQEFSLLAMDSVFGLELQVDARQPADALLMVCEPSNTELGSQEPLLSIRIAVNLDTQRKE